MDHSLHRTVVEKVGWNTVKLRSESSGGREGAQSPFYGNLLAYFISAC